jgi:hypothetical protein
VGEMERRETVRVEGKGVGEEKKETVRREGDTE